MKNIKFVDKRIRIKRDYSYSRLSKIYLNKAYEIILPISNIELKTINETSNSKRRKGA